MNSIKSKVTGTLFLTAAALATASAAARTAPGIAAVPYHFSDTCFTDTDNGLKSNCSAQRWVSMPMLWDNAGNKTVTVRASSGVSCFYWETTTTGAPAPGYTGAGVALTTGSASTITVVAGNFGKIQCSMNPGSTLYGLDILFP